MGIFTLRTSLARKISLLFGAAVLITIAVTLIFPQLQMTALNEQAMLMQAKRVASAAYQAVDLRSNDWSLAEENLQHQWPNLIREMGLETPAPHLVSLRGRIGGGFQRESMNRLQTKPQQRYYWRMQDNGKVFRFAMAVRATLADPHPDRLLGMIDVRIPADRNAGTWNMAVTILAGASGSILAILIFYMVTQRLVLSPVTSLRQVAEKVTSGDLEVRSSIESGDEFEDLSLAFNDMLIHLKNAQDEQRKVNRSLDVRLGELAETNIALYESNRLKSDFLANVTHELRTPLVSIIGFAELLRDAWQNPNTDRDRLARYSKNILISSRGLLEIINDLLDLAKIEAGEMELHLNEFLLDALCGDMIAFVQPLADKRNQRLVLEVEKSTTPFFSDSGKIKQILYNLLSNAIKFTPTGGVIILTMKSVSADQIELGVRDTGVGISPDQHEIIFEKFRQLDSSKTREYEGTGLGLAITQELVKMLGGTITLESQPGKGSLFLIALPRLVENESVANRRQRSLSRSTTPKSDKKVENKSTPA